jgi:tRNA wybutosine-synthesizing protein 1
MVSIINSLVSRFQNLVSSDDTPALPQSIPLSILYASKTGTAKAFAETLAKDAFALRVSGRHFSVSMESLETFNVETFEKLTFVVLVIPTWTDGTPSPNAQPLYGHLRDLATDFRVDKSILVNMNYAIFGLGNSNYGSSWCKAAIEIDSLLQTLSANSLVYLGKGDDSTDQLAQFHDWKNELWPTLSEIYSQIVRSDSLESPAGNSCGTCGSAAENGNCNDSEDAANSSSCGCSSSAKTTTSYQELLKSLPIGPNGKVDRSKLIEAGFGYGPDGKLTRLQYRREKRREAERQLQEQNAAARAAARKSSELGSSNVIQVQESALDVPNEEDLMNDKLLLESTNLVYESSDEDDKLSNPRKKTSGITDLEDMGKDVAVTIDNVNSLSNKFEMVTPTQRRALTKEGYHIIGTHSAVKICRWTKAQMRGRGGCYKWTFYGIQSYRCMEATPSLACANKCVFCWRHHKNPVGKEWRWAMDEPEFIVREAIAQHCRMVNVLKGMEGVLPNRLQEAYTVRHCALSLVGEPIMYPKINELTKLLHERRISTFLVTNAQFPEAIASLHPVTQLYVSIDAATKETLQAIDRPLFADFWQRFLASLDAIRERKQRTVYRLTLVKNRNTKELDAYAELVKRGQPDLIEVKGVTWCGESPGSDLTMADVPWHTDVREFCEELTKRIGVETYGLACEHAHSCCVLIARKDTCLRNGIWHTHIDFDKFQELVAKYYESNGKAVFDSTDYLAPTPSWALYGSEEAGFDPEDTRWRRGQHAYKPSESGCG